MSELEKKIEALVFYKGEEITFKELSKILGATIGEIKNDITNIKERYSDSGIKLITTEESVLFTTGEEVADIVEGLEKEEYEEKENELKNLANPIITKIYQQGTAPNMGEFNEAQHTESGSGNTGPKIEEVD